MKAEYKDDYFGEHKYGVKFPDDDVVYPFEQVKEAQLQTLWFDDVIQSLRELDIDELVFMETINKSYKKRWERDPIGGEGAIEWKHQIKGGEPNE